MSLFGGIQIWRVKSAPDRAERMAEAWLGTHLTDYQAIDITTSTGGFGGVFDGGFVVIGEVVSAGNAFPFVAWVYCENIWDNGKLVSMNVNYCDLPVDLDAYVEFQPIEH